MSNCCSKNVNVGEPQRSTAVIFNKAMPTVFSISGMTCASCEKTLKDLMSRIAGVESVDVDLNSSRAILTGSFQVDDVINATEKAGYPAEIVAASMDIQPSSENSKKSGCCCR